MTTGAVFFSLSSWALALIIFALVATVADAVQLGLARRAHFQPL